MQCLYFVLVDFCEISCAFHISYEAFNKSLISMVLLFLFVCIKLKKQIRFLFQTEEPKVSMYSAVQFL